jgi:hypothetical protein
MKLAAETRLVQRALQRIDPIRHEQRRAFVALGQKVAHRPIERSRKPYGDAVDRDQRERPVDGANRRRTAAQQSPPRLLEADVMKTIQPRIDQIDDAFKRTFTPF